MRFGSGRGALGLRFQSQPSSLHIGLRPWADPAIPAGLGGYRFPGRPLPVRTAAKHKGPKVPPAKRAANWSVSGILLQS